MINGIEIISVNTDGILIYTPEYNSVVIRCLLDYWQNENGFQLEEVEYDLYVRNNVNNYLARKTDGTIKIKGRDFVPQGALLHPYFSYDLPKNSDGMYMPINGILKGFEFPIVAIALQYYYLNDIEPEETIYNHTDIFDFTRTQKIKAEFTNYIELVKRKIITNRPPKIKRNIVQEKQVVDAVYEEIITTNKKGIEKTKRVKVSPKQVIPAIHEEIIVEGDSYVNPKIIDEVIERRKEQKTIRIFVSRPTIDGEYLIGRVAKKIKIEDGEEKSTVYCSNNFITLFNDYYPVVSFSDYNLDYDFYINKVWDVINKIGKIN